MAIHIANPITDAKIRRLSEALSLGLVETVELAVDEALARRNIDIAPPEPTGPGSEDELEAIIRRDLVAYKRLREEKLGQRSSTGYMPRMIRERGIVDALQQMAAKGTDGLRFLIDNDRLDLAVERWIADERFSHLFQPEIVAKAKQVLREAQLIIDARKKNGH
ncbi:MAG TPA: hypothetical protein VNS34_27050 [Rhizobiaceae bacterium]|nr:hypothetical protein [Rhizobiaceae bacterium]